MQLIYSTLRQPIEQKSYADWINKCCQKVSVSTKGLIAFTTSFCLYESRPNSTSYHVYVADINTPYQPYLVVDSAYDFTIIEWDSSGTKLLVCDIRGTATIYTSKDYLVSDWKLYYQQQFSAETFITAAWYHPGLVSTINISNQNLKNPSNHLEYNDKIQQKKFGASLRLFGGKSAEGCILITNTGLVCCLTLIADGSVDVVIESLSHIRTRIEAADICHHNDGSFIVSTSAGTITSTIAFYQIQLNNRNITLDEVDSFCTSADLKRVYVTCKQFNSFHLNIVAQILNESENSSPAFEKVSHIKFVTKDSPDDVLVEISGQNLSLVELWELEQNKKSPINSAILDIIPKSAEDIKPIINNVTGKVENNQQQTNDNFYSMKDWVFKGNYIMDKDLVTIQTPKFKLFGQNRQLNIILLAYKDSTISCLRKEDLQPVQESINLSSISHQAKNCDTNSPNKGYNHHNRLISSKTMTNGNNKSSNIKPTYITDIQFTCNQTVFIAIDSMSQLHAIKLPELITCQDGKDLEVYLQYILEYCLITGNDWWDVLVCSKYDSIESICDKFHDAYERQPKHIQRKYYNRQLMIRASLYRCLNTVGSFFKSSECHTMIMLNSIANTVKSMIRSPTDQDSPSEYLTNFLRTQGSQPTFFNINQVISKLNEKEFYVELNLIQCLQPLNQWVCDLAIYLIVSIPQRIRTMSQFPATGLYKNKEVLEILRELLVIIRIWGLQSETNMPMVHKLNEQMDVFATIFRLISIMYTTLGNEPEEMFVEECIHLSNNITVPEFSFLLDSIGVASPLLHYQQNQKSQQSQRTTITTTKMTTNAKCPELNLIFEYFRSPKQPESVNLPKIDGAINMRGNRKIDVVRNISLGANPVANLKHCTRCKSVSLTKPTFQTTRSWEQRWISSCICGGTWAKSDSAITNKLEHAHRSYHNPAITTFSNHNNQLVR